MNNLTDKEIQKIFALYVGCQAKLATKLHFHDLATEFNAELVDWINDHFIDSKIVELDLATIALWNPAYVKLILSPLNSITDEHALELAKIFNKNYEWKITERYQDMIVISCDDYKMWIDFFYSDLIAVEELYHGEENIKAHGCESEPCPAYNIVQMIDQLRDWGYALPYKGQSLFSLNLAIDKNKFNEKS